MGIALLYQFHFLLHPPILLFLLVKKSPSNRSSHIYHFQAPASCDLPRADEQHDIQFFGVCSFFFFNITSELSGAALAASAGGRKGRNVLERLVMRFAAENSQDHGRRLAAGEAFPVCGEAR